MVKPFYVLVIDVAVQNTVGHSNYGIYFAIFNFCYIFQIIADLGIQNYNSRYIAQNRNEISHFLSHILGLKLFLSILFLAISFFFFRLFAFDISWQKLFFIIAGNQVLISFILYLRSNFPALGFFKLDSFFSIADKLILIGILSYFLWFAGSSIDFTIYTFVYAQMAALGITAFLIIAATIKKMGAIRLQFKAKFNFSLLKKTWPYASVIILMSAYTRIDGVMLERLLGDGGKEAGIYAASYRILDAVNMVGFLMASFILPMFARMISLKQKVNSLVENSFRLASMLSLPFFAFIFFYSNDIMLFFYPLEGTGYYAQILVVLIASFIPITMAYIYGTLLTAGGMIHRLNFIFIFGFLMNVIMNYFLIEKYQALGAAWATLVTQSMVAIAQYILANKLFDLYIPNSLLLKLLLVFTLSLLFLLGLRYYTDLYWLLSLFLFFGFCFIVSLSAKVIVIKPFWLMFSNRLQRK